MSCPHIVWALDEGRNLNMAASDRLVLMVLSEEACGKTLICYRPQPYLAEYTGLSQRTVRSALRRLEEAELIKTIKAATGRSPAHYRVNRPSDRPANGDGQSESRDTVDRQNVPDKEAVDRQIVPVKDVDRQNMPGKIDPSDLRRAEMVAGQTAVDRKDVPTNPLSKEESKEGKKGTKVSRVRATGQATRLPEDWEPSDSDRTYAIAHNVDPDRASEDMRDYWCSRPGVGALKLDWSRTFHGRVRVLEEQGRCRLRSPATVSGKFNQRFKNGALQLVTEERAAGLSVLIPGDPGYVPPTEEELEREARDLGLWDGDSGLLIEGEVAHGD
jgi:DNA-binding Lrp family transcriptional regulator